ncbi:TPM domain-containing protein [Roseburia sp. 499]|uniref:TPM domain-containing protein n=1 Tax=Roseburia sp. 499 TaxID=1261634 RepID=UPI00095199FF|nr:TPM domain-containing protein [Roseburia sp. 499]WVK69248.1 TPM domain-containing protein [Roseburia sp. 499]
MRKRKYQSVLFTFLLTSVIVVGSGFSVNAEESTSNIQLIDQADLLTASEAEEVEEMIEEFEDKTGWDVMAVTTDDAEGMSAQYYAEKWFDDYTTCDDGIICLIDMDNREIQIRTFGEAIDCLNDNKIDHILDKGFEKVSDGEYAETFEVMLETTAKYAYKQITVMEAIIALVIALVAGGITVGGIIGSYRLKFGGYKYPIEKNGSVKLRKKEDTFVNQFVTHRHIPKSDGNGGSGGTTTHVGAGGRTSGGGGRKF